MKNVTIVWKDGTYKSVKENESHEYENDANWLATIPSMEIEFGEWLSANCEKWGNEWVWSNGDGKSYSIDGIFELFIKQTP